VLRGVFALGTLLALGLIAAGSTSAASRGCALPETRAHDEAVFGHFATRAGATRFAKHPKELLFQGIKIENEGCGDFEVEIDGADTQKDRGSFALEAAKSGFQVTFEQRADPLAYQPGEVYGVFAKKTTLASANALAWKLAAANFRYIDIVRVGARWWIVMPQVPVKSALSIAHEAASAGFHIAFQPGKK
jgi:hypothetical protein